jgi:signal transduction histidine kinase
LTLVLLFSSYAARAVKKPIERIVAELDRTDGVAEERHIPERGAVEVVKLAQALNGMRTRIRYMVDMRMRMLRSVSHDLRTPLTRLKLRVERLDAEGPRQAMLADIDRIDALVTETLDYLRVDALGEAQEPADVSSMLQTIQADFADVGFDVRFEGPDRLVANCRPNALARAVTNLCDNAVKFGKTVVISLSRTDDTVRIAVADDGPGIPADKRALVTEPFFKLDPARGVDVTQGFGLGLSIVADIAKAHGGTLGFSDASPRGLVVSFSFPAG